MKKMLKVIGTVILIFVVLIALIFIRAAMTPAVPDNYSESVNTGGDIEGEYLKKGTHEVSYFEQKTDEVFEKYEVWYPSDLKETDQKYPLIVVNNGTGVKASKYKAQFKHFASWGFIIIGTEEEESWDADAAEKSLVFLLEQNEDPSSIFYQKIDTDRIGTMGHSQGGAGVFNTVTAVEHSRMYKTAVSLSPTCEELTVGLKWNYDLEKISIPILMFAGTEGDFEMKTVIPEEAMRSMYDKIKAPKVMARRKGCEHGHMLYSADGYVTAWFMWQLQNDQKAANAFTGDTPELTNNALYQEQRIDLD